MGYYTNYELEIDSMGLDIPQCEHDIPANAKFCPECGEEIGLLDPEDAVIKWAKAHPSDDGYNIDTLIAGAWDACKWYDHEKDMRELSKVFPRILFTLSGSGEEPGDIWKEYYLNGKMQREKVEIKFSPFDKNKLK